MSLKESLFKVQSAVSKVHKDGKNPHTKSQYPTLESVLDVLNAPLQEHALIVTQFTQKKDSDWVLTTTVCTQDSKECESFDTPLLGLQDSKNPMQALGSATTYARRYSLMSYFKLAPTDDDGETTNLTFTQEKKPASQKPKNFAPPPKDMKIPMGKYAGKMASEIPENEMRDYIAKIEEAASQTGHPHPQWFVELRKVAGL